MLEELNKIVSSTLFANADRSRTLLKFVVKATVNRQADRLKKYTLGSEVLGGWLRSTNGSNRASGGFTLAEPAGTLLCCEGQGRSYGDRAAEGSYVSQFMDRVAAEVPAGMASTPEGVPRGRLQVGRLSAARGVAVAALFATIAIAAWGAMVTCWL